MELHHNLSIYLMFLEEETQRVDILQVELQDQFMVQQEDSQAHQVMEDLVEVQMERLIQVVLEKVE